MKATICLIMKLNNPLQTLPEFWTSSDHQNTKWITIFLKKRFFLLISGEKWRPSIINWTLTLRNGLVLEVSKAYFVACWMHCSCLIPNMIQILQKPIINWAEKRICGRRTFESVACCTRCTSASLQQPFLAEQTQSALLLPVTSQVHLLLSMRPPYRPLPNLAVKIIYIFQISG